MAAALSPGRSPTVTSQCLCKYDTALAFRAFKHSLKTRKGRKKERQREEKEKSRDRGGLGEKGGAAYQPRMEDLVEIAPLGFQFTSLHDQGYQPLLPFENNSFKNNISPHHPLASLLLLNENILRF